MPEQLLNGLDQLLVVAGLAVAMYVTVIAATRLSGLRSLAQLSAFDFVMTVSIGTILSSTALSRTVPLADGMVAVAVLFLAQATISVLRRRRSAQRIVDNQPSVLMVGTEMIDVHLRESRMTRDDLMAKLREHGITRLDQVGAVVLERTGEVSVLPLGDGGTPAVAEEILAGVRGADLVPPVR